MELLKRVKALEADVYELREEFVKWKGSVGQRFTPLTRAVKACPILKEKLEAPTPRKK